MADPEAINAEGVNIVERRVLSPDDQRAVHAILDAAGDADGVAALGEAPVAALGRHSPAVHHVLAFDADVLVGYASVLPGRDGEPSTVEAVVAPPARGRGIGTELLTAALAVGGADTRAWAHGDLPAARALAARLGLVPRRELLQLRRGLEELPALPSHDDIELRTYAGPADDAEILRVNNAAFDWHPEQGGWTAEQIVERTGADWFDPAGLFLAFDRSVGGADDAKLLGFHWTKIHDEQLGEVYIVGVDPAAQGRGLGRQLTLAGLHYLAQRVSTVTLYVEGDNTAALATYRNLGFARYLADVAYGRADDAADGP